MFMNYIMNYICLSLEILVLKHLRSLIRRGLQTMGAHLIYQQPTDYWRDPTKENMNTSPGLLLKWFKFWHLLFIKGWQN